MLGESVKVAGDGETGDAYGDESAVAACKSGRLFLRRPMVLKKLGRLVLEVLALVTEPLRGCAAVPAGDAELCLALLILRDADINASGLSTSSSEPELHRDKPPSSCLPASGEFIALIVESQCASQCSIEFRARFIYTPWCLYTIYTTIIQRLFISRTPLAHCHRCAELSCVSSAQVSIARGHSPVLRMTTDIAPTGDHFAAHLLEAG